MSTRIYDSFVGQRAFWNCLVLQTVQRLGATAELRFQSKGLNEPISISVRVHGEQSQAMASALRQVQHLLPSDYGWDLRAGENLASPKRMARIVRRLNYIDLPALLPGMESGPSVHGAAGGGSRVGTILPGLADLRELPPLQAVPQQGLTTQFCVALPAALDEYTPRQRVLFEEMQGAGEAAVSFCIHPVNEQNWGGARTTAMHWKRFLAPYVNEFAGAGLAEAAAMREAYTKFALPAKHLLNLTIRVATMSDETTIQLANIVAATSGGARAYDIYPPSRDSSPESLIEPHLDIPCLEWPEKRLQIVRSHVLNSLRENRIQDPDSTEDTAILDFLLHAPHVFTLEGAERLFRLPVASDEGLPGMESKLQPPFTIPSLKFTKVLAPTGGIAPGLDSEVRLGMIQHAGGVESDSDSRYQRSFWHSIKSVDLTKHALVVGSTGSGKTMTTLFIARELQRIGTPFMVVEPVKTEYYDRLKAKVPGLLRLRLERASAGSYPGDFLKFDPLRIPANVTVVKHSSYLKSCFEAAFPLDAVSSLVLETGLLRYYTAPATEGGCGLKRFDKGGGAPQTRDRQVYPSFSTFRDYFLGSYLKAEFAGTTPGSNRLAQDYYALFRRRFQNLDEGLVGECFRAADERTLREPNFRGTLGNLMLSNAVVELDAVPDAEHKALLMAFLLTFVFEYRQGIDAKIRAEGAVPQSGLKHMLIVEEAHRVLSTASQQGAGHGGDFVGQDSKAKAVSLFVDMLAEIRAFGQGIMIVEQIPTKIVSEAIKNTNLKIMLRLTSRDDRDYLGEAMNFSEAQKRFVTNLKVSENAINYVIFEEGVEQPLMLSLPLDRSVSNWLYDPFFARQEHAND